MSKVLQEIIDLLDVEPIDESLFRGQNHNTEHVFGGQVLAQALASAFRTVDSDQLLHSLHSYFLRAGDWTRPILYEVDRIRDGRSFSTRRVTAIQNGNIIFTLACSWQKPEDGLNHTVPMPDVPPPESLRGDLETYTELAKNRPEMARFTFRFDAIDSRAVERITMMNRKEHPPYKHTWLKARNTLPDNPEIHLALLAYMSDLDFMSTSMLPHGPLTADANGERTVQGASLDHAIWFHRPFRADEWLLFAKESPNASGARGFVRGHFFNRAGEMVATAAQECLIRPVGAARAALEAAQPSAG